MSLINDYKVQFKEAGTFLWETAGEKLLKSEAMDLIRILKKEEAYSNVTWRITSQSKEYKKEIAYTIKKPLVECGFVVLNQLGIVLADVDTWITAL